MNIGQPNRLVWVFHRIDVSGAPVMLLAASALQEYSIRATDGMIGTVADVLFDDRSWKIRWLVVDTGNWLPGRKVLIAPPFFSTLDIRARVLPVSLTQARVKASPSLSQDEPVSMQMQRSHQAYYGTDPDWGRTYFEGGLAGLPLPFQPLTGEARELAAEQTGYGLEDSGDPDLQSTKAITGYHIEATDGAIGHVSDLLLSDEEWGVRYLVVDTRNWWPGAHVLMSPYAVRSVDPGDKNIRLSVSQAKVRASPPWNPAAMIERAYETSLHRHYDWPGYGF
jgi:sporulation protein YlmC with PRC-barrel domain